MQRSHRRVVLLLTALNIVVFWHVSRDWHFVATFSSHPSIVADKTASRTQPTVTSTTERKPAEEPEPIDLLLAEHLKLQRKTLAGTVEPLRVLKVSKSDETITGFTFFLSLGLCSSLSLSPTHARCATSANLRSLAANMRDVDHFTICELRAHGLVRTRT